MYWLRKVAEGSQGIVWVGRSSQHCGLGDCAGGAFRTGWTNPVFEEELGQH